MLKAHPLRSIFSHLRTHIALIDNREITGSRKAFSSIGFKYVTLHAEWQINNTCSVHSSLKI